MSQGTTGTFPTVKWATINATASGDTQVVALVSSKKIRVIAVTFSCSAAVDVAWKSNTTVVINAMSFAQYGGMDVNRGTTAWFLETNAGEALNINLSATANVRGSICYMEI